MNLIKEYQILQNRLRECESILKLYADYKNYEAVESSSAAVYHIPNDVDDMNGCGGERARSYFDKYKDDE